MRWAEVDDQGQLGGGGGCGSCVGTAGSQGGGVGGGGVLDGAGKGGRGRGGQGGELEGAGSWRLLGEEAGGGRRLLDEMVG